MPVGKLGCMSAREMCESVACYIRLALNCKTNEGTQSSSQLLALCCDKNYLMMEMVIVMHTLRMRLQKLDLSSIWALMAAFDDPLPIPFEGAFVRGVDALSWMGNNSGKLSKGKQSPECWTLFSTGAYGKRNKVPQESIPCETAEKVKESMLEGVEAALGMEKGQLQRPSYTKLQLWGAALPTNSPGIPCIFDPQGRAGICGDWLLGSNMESAALSGIALANHIGNYLETGGETPAAAEEFGIGLTTDFPPIQGHDIGQFSGLKNIQQPVQDALHSSVTVTV
ncbi:unnamed protein product [Linum tenue]|uniref:Uncharacterized protein n=1 Tax=Linum tenue TaxID=586396 RepID=A0AAV0LI38_9ROSI|nr:unnamed protein product [Linum tenue]